MSSYYDQTDVSTPGTDDIEVDTADLYEALSTRRRRFVILLVDRFGTISISDAADRIAGFECEGRVASSDRKAVYVSLYQAHSDKLEEAGVVEYDERRKVFSESPLTATAADYVREGYNRFAAFEGAAEVLA